MKSRVVKACACAGVAAIAAGAVVLAQDRFGGRSQRSGPQFDVQGNTPYDGRFVFVRLKYSSGFSGFGFGRRGGGPMWSHDYPDGEVHFTKILEEITFVQPRTDGSNILSVDDPELCNYPVAYMAEPGYWSVSEDEAAKFRHYLLKGGFVIFDDFRGPHWDNLQEQMRRVLPEHRWVELDGTHPIFHSFFEIDHPLDLVPPYDQQYAPSYWGIFEGNDPNGRLLAIANVNNDISEYWEFSGTGYAPVDLTNEAYKFGINYVVYALTH